jgi:hypothetical protein
MLPAKIVAEETGDIGGSSGGTKIESVGDDIGMVRQQVFERVSTDLAKRA